MAADNITRTSVYLATTGLMALLCGASPASAQTAPSLGAAQSFAVLAGSTVTNTGASIVTGNLGVSPGSAVTGFPPGSDVGTIHAADAVALAAQNAVTTAYNSLAGQPCTQNLTGQDLGGLTLTAGVYCFDSSAQLTGTLTLNAQGNASAVFIFRMGSTLITASASSVVLINGGSPCNVFWQVGSSATLGTGTSFSGDILALTSITLTTGATLTGRALARNGAVTLDTDAVPAPCLVAGPVCPTITLLPATLPSPRVGVAFSQMLTASGGTAPYRFTVVTGTLPAGLTLTAAGVLAGTPTTVGTAVVTIRGTDANGCFASVTFTIVVAAALPPALCPTITLLPSTLPGGFVGVAYSQVLTGSGGTAPYLFSVTAGVLPVGVSLTPAGTLSGTATAVGTSIVTIRVTDANGCFASVAYTIVIAFGPPPPPNCPTIKLTPATLADATVGVAYSQTIVGSGGTAPYLFSVTAGALPEGLTLTPAGVLAGTLAPTTAASVAFTIRGTDANGCFAEVAYTMAIATAVPALPQVFAVTLALGLAGVGFFRLRRRARLG